MLQPFRGCRTAGFLRLRTAAINGSETYCNNGAGASITGTGTKPASIALPGQELLLAAALIVARFKNHERKFLFLNDRGLSDGGNYGGENAFGKAVCNDRNAGTSPSTAWATPHHAVNCGDVIIAAAGSYGIGHFGTNSWGAVSNCPAKLTIALTCIGGRPV